MHRLTDTKVEVKGRPLIEFLPDEVLVKTTHGGKREGAGRKPLGAERMHRLHVMLPPDLIAALRERAAAEKVSVNEIVRRALASGLAWRERYYAEDGDRRGMWLDEEV